MSRIKVFYDGACPACDRAMMNYKKLSRTTEIDWLDISWDVSVLKNYNISVSDAIAKLHVIDSHGDVIIGAESFVIIWEQLAYYHYFAYFCRMFKLIPLMDWIYNSNHSSTSTAQQCNKKDCH